MCYNQSIRELEGCFTVFIPIAAVIIFIWLIAQFVMGCNEAVYQRESARIRAGEQKMASSAEDRQLEEKLRAEIKKNKGNGDLVTAFMNDGRDWAPLCGKSDNGIMRVLAVAMAQHGKAPYRMIWHIGQTFPYKQNDLYSMEQWVMMNEEYMLALEAELRRHGVLADAMCRHNYPDLGPWRRLRDEVQKEGGGCTDAATVFRLTYDTGG